MRLKLFERIGEYCLSEKDGKKVYYAIKSALRMKEVMTIDCTRIRVVSTDFMDTAFGLLMKDFSPETFYTYVKFKYIKQGLTNHIQFSIEHFQKYYSDPEYKDEIDKYFYPEKSNIRMLEVKPCAEEKSHTNEEAEESVPLYTIERVDVRFFNRCCIT